MKALHCLEFQLNHFIFYNIWHTQNEQWYVTVTFVKRHVKSAYIYVYTQIQNIQLYSDMREGDGFGELQLQTGCFLKGQINPQCHSTDLPRKKKKKRQGLIRPRTLTVRVKLFCSCFSMWIYCPLLCICISSTNNVSVHLAKELSS